MTVTKAALVDDCGGTATSETSLRIFATSYNAGLLAVSSPANAMPENAILIIGKNILHIELLDFHKTIHVDSYYFCHVFVQSN